jgi:CBS domain containing-hemolysin-like protein
MTDADPGRAPEPPRRRGLLGLIDRFRRIEPEPPTPEEEAAAEATDELVSQARAFEDLNVDDVMKPRADIVAIARSCTFAEIVDRFIEAEHSRMPVYKDTLDEPVGVLQTRRNLVREALYVPGAMPAADLLALMRSRRTHMALVIDEFGGTDGLVTLEDLLEKLVGDISDEHDEADDDGIGPIVEDGGGWVADGRAPLQELEAALGAGVDLAPPDLDEEIETVAGLVNALAGRVPQKRETIPHPGGYVIEVLSADPRRVKRVRVRRAGPPGPPGALA